MIELGEVVGRRTETSRTVVADDGTFETTFYDHQVNFRDANGTWQPIDTTLVPGLRPGSLRAKSGPVEVSLPATLASAPVRVAKGDTVVELSLRGATRARASAGVPRSMVSPSEGLARSAATYRGALPGGVDVAYTALPEGVKEELVLSSPRSPASFDFDLRLSPGHTAVETPEGGVAVVDVQGIEAATLAPPFVADASYAPGALAVEGSGFSTETVTLRIAEPGPEPVLRLAVDPAWLAAPERVWPVVVDPSVTIPGASRDTFVGSSVYANNNYGSSVELGVQGGSIRIRSLHQRDLASYFDEPAVVTGARLELYATNDTSAAPRQSVAIHALTSSWSSTGATWNRRLSATPWTSTGGDYEALPLYRNHDAGPGAPGWRQFPVTRAVQGWVDGTRPNHGLIVKYENEASGPTVIFASSNSSDASRRPRLVVNWEPLQGLRDHYGYADFDLGQAGQAKVNLASGNLSVVSTDLDTPGSGLDALVRRFYNSRAPYIGSIGPRWAMWPQSRERLYESNADDLMWRGGPAERLMFSMTGRYDGSLTVPQGYPATMGVGALLRWVLAHDDGADYRFALNGYIEAIADAEGDTIAFGYVQNASGEWEMTSMSDSRAGVVSFERSAPDKVVRLVDPSGASHRTAMAPTVPAPPCSPATATRRGGSLATATRAWPCSRPSPPPTAP